MPRNAYRNPRTGTAFVHTVIDDHSRVAYAEIHSDETATAAAVLRRAVAWSADRGVTVERVLSDNGSAYRSHAIGAGRRNRLQSRRRAELSTSDVACGQTPAGQLPGAGAGIR